MRKKIIFLILIFLLVLISCTKQNFVLIDNNLEKIKINVEIADTDEERSKGLMFREFLDEDSGMLFIFDNENYYGFWMKNTLIPLDMIFIDKNFEIVDIIYAEPCKKEPCKSYRPIKPAKYVLEVSGNFTIKNDVSIGNKIRIQ